MINERRTGLNISFTVGDVLTSKNNLEKYRIIFISNSSTVLIQLNTTKFVLKEIESHIIVDLLNNGLFEIDKEVEDKIFDETRLSDSVRISYLKKLQIINAIISVYGPDFMGLSGKISRPDIKELCDQYGISKSTFWKSVRDYFQSGMKNISLVDVRAFGVSKGKTYSYTKKPGRKSEYLNNTGVILTNEIKQYFDDALEEYKSGRKTTIQSAFDYMNAKYFMITSIENGKSTYVLRPESERPTIKQFYYYFEKIISAEEREIIKTSAMESRNNKRLLLSDILDGVMGPGDMVEIDACEADISLVSEVDRSQSVGRPIVYFMIDVYTRIILAVSVAFDNNSILGVTNLFLNLADDKQEFCERYGITFDDVRLWPSNIIPRRIRVDRGSEFKSKEFDRICITLGIEKNIVSGGSGSLKGLVEQSFHQMHSKQNVHLEDHGLIEKRYDSEHHKESTLTIYEYTKMIINFVINHNQTFISTYRLTKEMLQKNIKPIPALLWNYGIEKYGHPRIITSKVQFYFDLMQPVKAKITRRGIHYKGLYYLPEKDPKLYHIMFTVGKGSKPIEVKMDMRDIGNVYYVRDGKLFVAHLNVNLSGNAEYSGLTMKEWDDYRKTMGKMKAEGKIHNEKVSVATYINNRNIVKESKHGRNVSNTNNMRIAREIEKQRVSSGNKIANRLTSNIEPEILPEQPSIVSKKNTETQKTPEQIMLDKRIAEIRAKQDINPTSITSEEASLLMEYAIDNFDSGL